MEVHLPGQGERFFSTYAADFDFLWHALGNGKKIKGKVDSFDPDGPGVFGRSGYAQWEFY